MCSANELPLFTGVLTTPQVSPYYRYRITIVHVQRTRQGRAQELAEGGLRQISNVHVPTRKVHVPTRVVIESTCKQCVDTRTYMYVRTAYTLRARSHCTETNFGVSAKAEPPLRRKPRFPRRRFFESGTFALAYPLLRKRQLLTFFWQKVWRKLFLCYSS